MVKRLQEIQKYLLLLHRKFNILGYMNKRLMFSATFVMALLSANAQKRAFTIEDLYRVKGVSSVSLSPDGKTVCYTASSSDLKNQKSGFHDGRI